MIAQLSQSDPFGSPSSSSSGVRCAGSLRRNSGVVVCPQTSTSSKSSPAARTKIRALRLLTLGVRMLSVFAAMDPSGLDLDRRNLLRLQVSNPGLRRREMSTALRRYSAPSSHGPQIANVTPALDWMLTYSTSPSGLNVEPANSSATRCGIVLSAKSKISPAGVTPRM